MLVVGVRPHPQPARSAIEDLAAVVGVGVGDHHELDVLQLEPHLVERALEVAEQAGSCVPVSTSTIRSRPRSPTRCAGRPATAAGAAAATGQGTRSPRPTSRGRVGLRMGQVGTVPAWSKLPKAVMTAYFEALANQIWTRSPRWAPEA